MKAPLIVDVREPGEYERGHVEGSVNIPPAELMAGAPQLQNVPLDTEIIVYCVSGSRSNMSIPMLRALGYTNVTNGINKQQVEALLRKDS